MGHISKSDTKIQKELWNYKKLYENAMLKEFHWRSEKKKWKKKYDAAFERFAR